MKFRTLPNFGAYNQTPFRCGMVSHPPGITTAGYRYLGAGFGSEVVVSLFPDRIFTESCEYEFISARLFPVVFQNPIPEDNEKSHVWGARLSRARKSRTQS